MENIMVDRACQIGEIGLRVKDARVLLTWMDATNTMALNCAIFIGSEKDGTQRAFAPKSDDRYDVRFAKKMKTAIQAALIEHHDEMVGELRALAQLIVDGTLSAKEQFEQIQIGPEDVMAKYPAPGECPRGWPPEWKGGEGPQPEAPKDA